MSVWLREKLLESLVDAKPGGQLVEAEQGTSVGGAPANAQKLVVSEVHQYQIGAQVSDMSGHVEAHITGDRGHGEVDDLAPDTRPCEHLLQSEGERLGGPVGESLAGGLPQHEDSECPGLLVAFEENRLAGRGNTR